MAHALRLVCKPVVHDVSLLVSAFRWTLVHCRVFELSSHELFPWTQVEQHDNCLVLCLHFSEDVVMLLWCVVVSVRVSVVCVRALKREFVLVVFARLFSPRSLSYLLLCLFALNWCACG